MILEFTIKNFGPIRDEQTLSFEASKDTEHEDYYCVNIKGTRVLKLAAIYGPNASGKSTVLKAFEFLLDMVFNPLEQKEDTFKYDPFLFVKDASKISSSLGLIFFIEDVKYDYKVNFNKSLILDEALYYYPNGKKAKLYTRETFKDESGFKSSIEYGSKVNISYKEKIILEGNTIWNNTVLGALSKSNVNISDLDYVIKWFYQYVTYPITPVSDVMRQVNKWIEGDEKIKYMVSDLIRNADFHISDFEFQEREEKININNISEFALANAHLPEEEFGKMLKEKKGKIKDVIFHHKVKDLTSDVYSQYKLFSSQESSGTLRYYELSGVLAYMILHPSIIPIDEIESSLHPDMMKQFILTFLTSVSRAQLLFTTHNVQFLTNSEMLRSDVIWFTEKQQDGATELYSLNDFDSKTYRKGYNSIFNAYNIGKFGAKPKLGNVFLNLEQN